MLLLVGSCSQALPAVPVPASCRRLVLPANQTRGEEALRRALEARPWELVVSLGFAAAADNRLGTGDLLLATRVFGGADVYLDLPPAQAPGAFAGSLCTLALPLEPAGRRVPLAPQPARRLPPVYAFDDSAFWLARACEGAGRRCLVLRAIVLAGQAGAAPNPFLQVTSRLTARSLMLAAARRPASWRQLRPVREALREARRQLATTLTILLMLQQQASQTA